MMELGACLSLLVKCHPLGYDGMQQVQTKVAHLAKVTGRLDYKSFSVTSTFFCVRHSPLCFSLLHEDQR